MKIVDRQSDILLTFALRGAVYGGRDMFLDGFILIASCGCQNCRRCYRSHHTRGVRGGYCRAFR